MATKDEPVVLCERVELENCGHEVAIITINRPDRLNCFNEEVCLGLSDIFARIADEIDARDSQKNPNQETSTLVAVILTGAGKSFCAGADLSNPPNPLSQSSDLLCYLRVNPVYQMDRVQMPIIGSVKEHVSSACYSCLYRSNFQRNKRSFTTQIERSIYLCRLPVWQQQKRSNGVYSMKLFQMVMPYKGPLKLLMKLVQTNRSWSDVIRVRLKRVVQLFWGLVCKWGGNLRIAHYTLYER